MVKNYATICNIYNRYIHPFIEQWNTISICSHKLRRILPVLPHEQKKECPKAWFNTTSSIEMQYQLNVFLYRFKWNLLLRSACLILSNSKSLRPPARFESMNLSTTLETHWLMASIPLCVGCSPSWNISGVSCAKRKRWSLWSRYWLFETYWWTSSDPLRAKGTFIKQLSLQLGHVLA